MCGLPDRSLQAVQRQPPERALATTTFVAPFDRRPHSAVDHPPAPSRRSAGVRHGDELTLTTNILMQLAVRTRGSTNSRRTSGYGRNSSPGQRAQTAIGSADSIQDGRLRHRRFGHTRPDAGTHTSMRCRRGGRADVAQRRGHVGAADCLGRGEAARQRSDQCDARAFPWKRRSSLRVRSTRKADLCG